MNADERRAAVDLTGAQTSDVKIDAAAARDVVNYHGLPARQVLTLIAEQLGDERQWRRLRATVDELQQQQLDERLDELRETLAHGLQLMRDELAAQRVELRWVWSAFVALFVVLVAVVLLR